MEVLPDRHAVSAGGDLSVKQLSQAMFLLRSETHLRPAPAQPSLPPRPGLAQHLQSGACRENLALATVENLVKLGRVEFSAVREPEERLEQGVGEAVTEHIQQIRILMVVRRLGINQHRQVALAQRNVGV